MCLDPERVRSSRMVQRLPARRASSTGDHAERVRRDARPLLRRRRRRDLGDIDDLLSDLDDDGSDDAREGAPPTRSRAAADNELVKLVNKIIVDAYNQGASDIHVEPYPGKAKTGIRFRMDGTLAPYIEVPAQLPQPRIVARLKIMCDLDISEKRKPQDGKIKFKKFGPLDIELRVATIPTAGGVEDIVMRILAAGEPIPLDKLGFSPRNLEQLQHTRRQALRPVLRLRADRLGQDHHAALGAQVPQHARHQDLDRRGPGRDHAEGPAPGAGEPEGGPRLRRGDERVPARRPRHHHGRRDARQGNRRRPASRPRSPATWCSPRCTPTRRRNRSSACSTWAWTRSTSPTRCSASWRSAWRSACATARRPTRRTQAELKLVHAASTARS